MIIKTSPNDATERMPQNRMHAACCIITYILKLFQRLREFIFIPPNNLKKSNDSYDSLQAVDYKYDFRSVNTAST